MAVQVIDAQTDRQTDNPRNRKYRGYCESARSLDKD